VLEDGMNRIQAGMNRIQAGISRPKSAAVSLIMIPTSGV